jgi:hypothetical protein
MGSLDCIEWGGARTSGGYGERRVDGRVRYVHRLTWEAEHGPIPNGLHVLHACDNPPCFNIDHLFLGTAGDNARDKAAKGRVRNGRERDHCVHGHPYDEVNTYWRKDRPGHRECRACRRGGQ